MKHNKRVNRDILASFPFWVASPLYPKLQYSQNALYTRCYDFESPSINDFSGLKHFLKTVYKNRF